FMKKIVRNRLRRGLIEWVGGASVSKTNLLFTAFFAFPVVVSASPAKTDNLNFEPQFVFKDRNGKTVSAPIVEKYQQKKLVYPAAKVDPRVHPKLMRADTSAD